MSRTGSRDSDQQLPPGYFLEIGGSYSQMIEAFGTLGWVFALALLLVYMVMASQFESLLHPFIIMFTIPLCMIGIVLGLLAFGHTVNLAVGIGIILLAGVAVNNAIVMIDYTNQLRRGGMDKKEAILQGSVTRLRPVLLTALTTILGVLPMAIDQRPRLRDARPPGRHPAGRSDDDDLPDAVRHPGHLQSF